MAATATAASASTSVILQSTYPSRQSCQFLGSSSPALANLAFRVRVFDPESSADHSAATAQPHAHHAHAAAVAVAVSGLQPGSHSHGGNGISIHLAESNAVTGNQPIVDQVVAWQEQIRPPIPATCVTGPFLHTDTHPQLVSHLASTSHHAAKRLTRGSAIDMHVYLSIPSSSPPSTSARNSNSAPFATYTLARMRLSPASGALSVSPPLGTLARVTPDTTSMSATARAFLPWTYVIELDSTPLPQAQVLDTLRLGLESLKQSHLLSSLPPTRQLQPPPPDLRHTQRIYISTLIHAITLRLTETKLPLYASHVSVAWRVHLHGGGWQVADADAAQVLAGTSPRVRIDAPSMWAYVLVSVWRWVWVLLGGGVFGIKTGSWGGGDGHVRRIALGVPVDVVLVQRAAQADSSARPQLHLTIYCDPSTQHTPASWSRSATRGPNRYLLGTCTVPLALTPAAAPTRGPRTYAMHRPVLPPSARMTEAVFGTPALPYDAKWPTVVAGHVEVGTSVAVQAARAGGAAMAAPMGMIGSGGGGGIGGVNAESVQAAVVRARNRLAAIKAAQGNGGTSP